MDEICAAAHILSLSKTQLLHARPFTVGMVGTAADGQAEGMPASHLAATLAASAARPRAAAPEASSLRGLRRDAEGSQVAETVREAYDLPLSFRMVRNDGRIHHSLGRFHNSGGAYGGWALPPNVGRPAGCERGNDA